MISPEEIVGMTDLTEEEVEAIAEHEHTTTDPTRPAAEGLDPRHGQITRAVQPRAGGSRGRNRGRRRRGERGGQAQGQRGCEAANHVKGIGAWPS